MSEKQKPEFDVVSKAAKLMTHPELATETDVKRMAARILNDERNAPQPNKTVPKPLTARERADKRYSKPKGR